MIAVVMSVAAEARVAGIVVVLQWFVMVVDWFVVVVMVMGVDGDGHWDLHRHRDGLLHWDVLLDGHWVWAIDWELDRNGDGLLNGVWDLDEREERNFS